MNSNETKLRERVKELNCLYKLSRVAWEAKNDLGVIVSKTLEILPSAMQHPEAAEASISIYSNNYLTPGFNKTTTAIAAELRFDKKRFGSVKIGYRVSRLKKRKMKFLPEENHLLKVVSQELALVLHRASIEEEKDKLQIQLQHAERLAFVGELSAGIAHELNEPLGRVLGFAQLIKKAGNLNEQQTEDLERIIKASLFSREIIKKLMIFSRQMPKQVNKVNLNNIVHNILYFIDLRFQSSGITIMKQLEPTLPEILADEVQLSQVLVNLITNSVYAMPNGGTIRVITKRSGNSVKLIVKDTGTGMTPQIKDKIFEPFFTTKPEGQGTGLGLSVVQGIIDSHHGQIIVHTTAGKGTKFEIVLPIKQEKKKRK
jgi:two-component system, NtrC family, sensor kinase